MWHAIYCQASHRRQRYTSQGKIRKYGFTQTAFLVVVFDGDEFAAGDRKSVV